MLAFDYFGNQRLKVGDTVKRVRGSFGTISEGDVGKIIEVIDRIDIKLDIGGYLRYDSTAFVLVEASKEKKWKTGFSRFQERIK